MIFLLKKKEKENEEKNDFENGISVGWLAIIKIEIIFSLFKKFFDK